MSRDWEICKLLQAYGDLLKQFPSPSVTVDVAERIRELIAEYEQNVRSKE